MQLWSRSLTPCASSAFEKAATALEAVVKGKATCFKVEEKEYEDEEVLLLCLNPHVQQYAVGPVRNWKSPYLLQVSEEKEIAFVDKLCDGLMDVASVYGPYWEPFFRKLLPSLLDYLVHDAPTTQRENSSSLRLSGAGARTRLQ